MLVILVGIYFMIALVGNDHVVAEGLHLLELLEVQD